MNDNYKTYSIDELVSDEVFIRWVKGFDPEKDFVWENWLEQNPGKREDVEAAKLIVLSIAFTNYGDTAIDQEDLWNKIQKSTQKEQKPKAKNKKVSILQPAIWAAAATIALFLIFKPFAAKETSILAKAGEHVEMQLPDQSTVTLNAGSEMRYNPKSWEKRRDVNLDGEAFFNVKEGARFLVNTNLGKVEVLGTSFNVFSRGKEFIVYCKTGKVKVSTLNGKFEAILTPGNSATLTGNGNLASAIIDEDIPMEWMSGVFRYNGDPMESIFDEFERQYSVEILSNTNIDTMRYTGSFNNDEFEKALRDITWPMNLNAQIDGNKITVTKQEE